MSNRVPESRYIVNNDHEGDIHAVSRKALSFRLAQQWADEDGITYYVIDLMCRKGAVSLWEFPPRSREDQDVPTEEEVPYDGPG